MQASQAEERLVAELLGAPALAESDLDAKDGVAEVDAAAPVSNEQLVEQTWAQLSADDVTMPTSSEPNDALTAEAMQAQSPENLDGLLDEVISEPAPAVEVIATPKSSEPVLVAPPKTTNSSPMTA